MNRQDSFEKKLKLLKVLNLMSDLLLHFNSSLNQNVNQVIQERHFTYSVMRWPHVLELVLATRQKYSAYPNKSVQDT